jgi:hypothetical protein
MALPGGSLIRFGRKSGSAVNSGPALNELFAALPTPLLVIDTDGLIADANIAPKQCSISAGRRSSAAGSAT